jgi:ABC-2 type transport system ATP-binding protein
LRSSPDPSDFAPGDGEPILAVEEVSFSYGERFQLRDVSFAVPRGTFFALLGPNGAGKTTLFALIARLLETGHGQVRIGGADVRRAPGRALAALGVVFQQPTLDLDLTVAQNLRYFACLHGLKRRETERRIESELGRLGLEDRRDQKVRTLSGGYRRRAEVARALLHRPALLLLDEPTVGLDVPTRQRIVEYVHGLAREDGLGVLWATHLIDEVRDGDHVIILHEGRIRARGTLAEVTGGAGAPGLAATFHRLTTTPTHGQDG